MVLLSVLLFYITLCFPIWLTASSSWWAIVFSLAGFQGPPKQLHRRTPVRWDENLKTANGRKLAQNLWLFGPESQRSESGLIICAVVEKKTEVFYWTSGCSGRQAVHFCLFHVSRINPVLVSAEILYFEMSKVTSGDGAFYSPIVPRKLLEPLWVLFVNAEDLFCVAGNRLFIQNFWLFRVPSLCWVPFRKRFPSQQRRCFVVIHKSCPYWKYTEKSEASVYRYTFP